MIPVFSWLGGKEDREENRKQYLAHAKEYMRLPGDLLDLHDGNAPPWTIALHIGLHFPGRQRTLSLVGRRTTDMVVTAAGDQSRYKAMLALIEVKEAVAGAPPDGVLFAELTVGTPVRAVR